MKNLDKQFKELKKSVSLSADEKSSMLARLHEYQEYKPIKADNKKTGSWLIKLMQYRFVPATLIIALVILSGAGVSFASTDSLPGDMLYPIKELREEIKSKVIFDEEKLADWETERALRRVEEAKKLKEKGKLSKERAEFIERKIKKHNAKAKLILMRIEKNNPKRAKVIREKLIKKLEKINNPIEKTGKKERKIERNNTVRKTVTKQKQEVLRKIEKNLPTIKKRVEAQKRDADIKIIKKKPKINSNKIPLQPAKRIHKIAPEQIKKSTEYNKAINNVKNLVTKPTVNTTKQNYNRNTVKEKLMNQRVRIKNVVKKRLNNTLRNINVQN